MNTRVQVAHTYASNVSHLFTSSLFATDQRPDSNSFGGKYLSFDTGIFCESMGKRKSSSKPVTKQKVKLDTSFDCLFCNHEKVVVVKM